MHRLCRDEILSAGYLKSLPQMNYVVSHHQYENVFLNIIDETNYVQSSSLIGGKCS